MKNLVLFALVVLAAPMAARADVPVPPGQSALITLTGQDARNLDAALAVRGSWSQATMTSTKVFRAPSGLVEIRCSVSYYASSPEHGELAQVKEATCTVEQSLNGQPLRPVVIRHG